MRRVEESTTCLKERERERQVSYHTNVPKYFNCCFRGSEETIRYHALVYEYVK